MPFPLDFVAERLGGLVRSRSIWGVYAVMVIGICLALVFSKQQSVADAEMDVVEFGVGLNWDRLCISSQYEIPDIEVERMIGVRCWDGEEVPNKKIFLTYRLVSGRCKGSVISGDFLERDHSETRCYLRSELSGKQFVKTGGIYSIKDSVGGSND
jgi:hypothetical protein